MIGIQKNFMSEQVLQIAIDGPVGSGKSFIASELAKRLGITYIYTGAMYRALSLACSQNNVPYKDVSRVYDLLQRIQIDLLPAKIDSTRPCCVLLNGADVTEDLFTPTNDQGTSDVSTIPEVRKWMVNKQQEMIQGKSVVMEGRDIGLRVLPNAQLKIFLTASIEERSKRRRLQYEKKGIQKSEKEIIEETKIRDTQDMNRDTDPLQILPDSWILDTTLLSPEMVIEMIVSELKKRKYSL